METRVQAGPENEAYEAPTLEVISLSCEISAYTPYDDDLF